MELAKQGLAIAITNDAGEILDGSCPIATRDDPADAIQSFGRPRNKSAVEAHVIGRAEALGTLELLPAGWASKAWEQTPRQAGGLGLTWRGRVFG